MNYIENELPLSEEDIQKLKRDEKRIIIILLSVCLVVGVIIIAACGWSTDAFVFAGIMMGGLALFFLSIVMFFVSRDLRKGTKIHYEGIMINKEYVRVGKGVSYYLYLEGETRLIVTERMYDKVKPGQRIVAEYMPKSRGVINLEVKY